MALLFIAAVICNTLIRNVFVPIFVFSFLFFIFELIVLHNAKKQSCNLNNEWDRNVYRFGEIDFNDDCIVFTNYNYYLSSFFSIDYKSVKKISFTKDTVLVFSPATFFIFSRADITETEESAFIDFLKQKLSADKFNADKIPKRNTTNSKLRQLIQEKDIINYFPVTTAHYVPSPSDINTSRLDHKTGKRINTKQVFIIAGIISLCFLTLGIIGLIFYNDNLFNFGMSIAVLGIMFLSVQGLSLRSVKKAFERSAQITANRITISDYFVEWETVYQDGIVVKTAYNLAAVTSLSETRDHLIFLIFGASYAVPKAAFESLDIPRQIFLKELGPKYRRFPDQ